jgi:hypothetical protein
MLVSSGGGVKGQTSPTALRQQFWFIVVSAARFSEYSKVIVHNKLHFQRMKRLVWIFEFVVLCRRLLKHWLRRRKARWYWRMAARSTAVKLFKIRVARKHRSSNVMLTFLRGITCHEFRMCIAGLRVIRAVKRIQIFWRSFTRAWMKAVLQMHIQYLDYETEYLKELFLSCPSDMVADHSEYAASDTAVKTMRRRATFLDVEHRLEAHITRLGRRGSKTKRTPEEDIAHRVITNKVNNGRLAPYIRWDVLSRMYIAHLWERAKFLGMWDEAHDHNLAEQQVEMDFTEVFGFSSRDADPVRKKKELERQKTGPPTRKVRVDIMPEVVRSAHLAYGVTPNPSSWLYTATIKGAVEKRSADLQRAAYKGIGVSRNVSHLLQQQTEHLVLEDEEPEKEDGSNLNGVPVVFDQTEKFYEKFERDVKDEMERNERELLEAPTRKGPVRKLSKSTLRIAKRYSKMAEEVV